MARAVADLSIHKANAVQAVAAGPVLSSETRAVSCWLSAAVVAAAVVWMVRRVHAVVAVDMPSRHLR